MITDWHSMRHCTANEDGNKEVSVEFRRTFVDCLFRKPAKVCTWVYLENVKMWVDKNTGKSATPKELCTIVDIIQYFQSLN